MRAIFLIIAILFVPADARAQSYGTDQLTRILTDLKNSADRLSGGNAALLNRNDGERSQLGLLQARLKQLADENGVLTAASLKLQESNPSRARKLAQLEKELSEVSSGLQGLQEQVRTDRASIERNKTENARLAGQIAALGMSLPAPAPVPAAPVDMGSGHAKEKLRLLKMIYESKQKQEGLYLQISDAGQRKPVAVVTVETARDKEHLLDEVRRLQAEISGLNAMAAQPAPTAQQGFWSPDQLRQLQAQVKTLQKNSDQMEDLLGRMQQKALKTAPKDRRGAPNRLGRSLEDLQREGQVLKQDLQDLREEMVELDKRKTYLESVVPSH